MDESPDRSFGVFKPVGHLVASFPDGDMSSQAMDALKKQQLDTTQVRRYTDREMLSQIDVDIKGASLLASIGQEMNLIKAHRELAERGYHWLVIPAGDRDEAARIADVLATCGAERAQYYTRLIIEEMIEHSEDLRQVAESPDRQLDAQTRSGTEAERAEIRPPEEEEPGR
jgi:hypothetical protein